MISHYILDEEGNPVPEPDFFKWGRWYETAERHVGNTFLDSERIHISTVFLSMVHLSKDLGDDRPMLYETMVFADEATLKRLMELSETDDRSIFSRFLGGIDIQKRYATKAEAIEGHRRMCEFVAVCLAKGLLQEGESTS